MPQGYESQLDNEYSPFLERRGQSSLFSRGEDNLSVVWQLISSYLSGANSRLPGTLPNSYDSNSSLNIAISNDLLASVLGDQKAVDALASADTVATIVDKIAATAGLGTDVKARAAIHKFASYVTTLGPQVIGTAKRVLQADLESSDMASSAIGSVLKIAEDALDATYGKTGSRVAAFNIVKNSLENVVRIENQSPLLAEFMHERFPLDKDGERMFGESARTVSEVLAWQADNGFNPLNTNTEASRQMTRDAVMNREIVNNDGQILFPIMDRLTRRAANNIFQGIYSQTRRKSIRDLAGKNEDGFYEYALQLEDRHNLEREIAESDVPDVSNNVFSPFQLTEKTNMQAVQTKIMAHATNVAKSGNKAQSDKLMDLAQRVGEFHVAQKGYKGKKSWKEIESDILVQQRNNIRQAAQDFGSDVNDDLAQAFQLAAKIEKQYGKSIDQLTEKNKEGEPLWASVTSDIFSDNEYSSTLEEFFEPQNGKPSRYETYQKFRTGITTKLGNDYNQQMKEYIDVLNTKNQQKIQEFEQSNPYFMSAIQGTVQGKFAAGQDLMPAYHALNSALQATGSTINGQEISDVGQVMELVKMITLNGLGTMSTQQVNSNIAHISYGMIQTNTQIDEVLQMSGIAGNAAKEVGGHSEEISELGVRFGLATKYALKEQNIVAPEVSHLAAKAVGLASRSELTGAINSILSWADDKSVSKIRDKTGREIVQKMRTGGNLTQSERRYVKENYESMLGQMGRTGSQIYNDMQAEYSGKTNRYAVLQGANDLMDSEEMLRSGKDTAFVTLKSENASQSILKNDTILEAIYDVATSDVKYSDDANREEAADKVLEAVKGKVSSSVYASLKRMDKRSIGSAVRDVQNSGAREFAGGNRATYVGLRKVASGPAIDQMESFDIASAVWQNMPENVKNAWNRVFTAMQENPDANLGDLLKEFTTLKLSETDKDKLATQAAVMGLADDKTKFLADNMGEQQRSELQALITSINNANKGNMDDTAMLLERATGGDKDAMDRLKILARKGGKSESAVPTLIDAIQDGKRKTLELINKAPEEDVKLRIDDNAEKEDAKAEDVSKAESKDESKKVANDDRPKGTATDPVFVILKDPNVIPAAPV